MMRKRQKKKKNNKNIWPSLEEVTVDVLSLVYDGYIDRKDLTRQLSALLTVTE
jgi:hypothetical protein